MSEEANKQVVLAYVDAFNRGDLLALRKLFTPDALIWGVLGWGGMDQVEPVWKMLHETLGTRLTVEAMIAEGDTVAVRYTERGTSLKPFMGHAPTGKSYEIVAMEWFVLHDGKIHRRWGARDSATQMRQMELGPRAD